MVRVVVRVRVGVRVVVVAVVVAVVVVVFGVEVVVEVVVGVEVEVVADTMITIVCYFLQQYGITIFRGNVYSFPKNRGHQNFTRSSASMIL